MLESLVNRLGFVAELLPIEVRSFKEYENLEKYFSKYIKRGNYDIFNKSETIGFDSFGPLSDKSKIKNISAEEAVQIMLPEACHADWPVGKVKYRVFRSPLGIRVSFRLMNGSSFSLHVVKISPRSFGLT